MFLRRVFFRAVRFALAWSVRCAVGAGLSLTSALAKPAAVNSTWEFQHKGANYRVIEAGHSHQIFMAVCCDRPLLILFVVSPYDRGKDAVHGKFLLTFGNGDQFSFNNSTIIFNNNSNKISMSSDFPKKYFETFLRA